LRLSRFSECGEKVKVISDQKAPPKAVVVIFDSTDPSTFYAANAVLNAVDGVETVLVAERQHLPNAWSVDLLKNFFDPSGEENLKIVPLKGENCEFKPDKLKELIETS